MDGDDQCGCGQPPCRHPAVQLDQSVNVTGADDVGVFRFEHHLAGGGTGSPAAKVLLGLPADVDQTASGPNMDGHATHYSIDAQDEWRAP